MITAHTSVANSNHIAIQPAQRALTLNHLALVMDGNRRWAKKQGLRAFYGHGQGVETVHRVIEFCIRKGIGYLSLYTFSIENFRRAPDEIQYLFDLLVRETEKGMKDFMEKGIRIRFVGDRSLFPESVRPAIERVEQTTAANKTLQVSLLFCYGGRQEIVAGVKSLIAAVKNGEISEHDLNEELFNAHLWTAGIPEPDLIIRTGGARRLSNFLLFQAAYAELCFVDCLWPELQFTDLEKAVEQYEACQRNFGC